jgi:hypothetical protein
MPRASPLLSSFNAGELSPNVEGRVEVQKYPNGCKRLENFIPLVQGPAKRRGGTRFVAELKDSSKRAWLVRFLFNTQQAYQLEFGDGYIRFFTNHGQVLVSGVAAYGAGTAYVPGDLVLQGGVNYYCIANTTGNAPPNGTYWHALTGSIYEIPSPYALADLTAADGTFNLRFVESNDVLYFVHGSYQPRKLSRFGATRWTLTTLTPAGGPFKTAQTNTTTVFASARTGTITLAASAAIFLAGHMGSLFQLEQKSILDVKQWEPGKAIALNDLRRSDGKNYKALNAATTGGNKPIHTEGSVYDGDTGVQWEFQDPGYGNATITAIPAAASKTITGAADNGAGLVRLLAVAHGFATGYRTVVAGVTGTTEANGTWTVTVIDADHFDLQGSAFVSAYVAGGTASTILGTLATATVNAAIPSNAVGGANASTRWAFGALSDIEGWPSRISFFKERLSLFRGQQYWLSVSGDYEVFTSKDDGGVVTADMAISGTLQADQVNDIQWAAPGDALIVGTAGAEFAIQSLTANQPFGPENVTAPPVSAYGSKPIAPVRVGDVFLFVQKSGLVLRDITYDPLYTKFRSFDQTVFADHIASSGILQLAHQQDPFSITWAMKASGALVAMTYSREQYESPPYGGWHRHPIGGSFAGGNAVVEAISTGPTPAGDRDELWMIVKRTINGVTKRYVEYMEAERRFNDDPEDSFYVDCGLTLNNTINATLTPGANAVTQTATGVIFAAGGAVFSAGDVGREIHYRYSTLGSDDLTLTWRTAKALITAYTDPTHVVCSINAAFPSASLIAANGWRMTVTTISGLGHLEGQTVDVLVNGATHPQRVVTAGAITLQDAGSKVHVGLHCPARLQTERLNAGGADGTSQGKTARINKAVIRFFESLGIKYGATFDSMDEIGFRTALDLMDNPPALYSGDLELDWPGDYNSNPWLCFEQSDPLPCTIIGVMPTVSTQDRG